MPNTNVLIVNNELTKIKITVVINLEWHNLDYPCYLVGRTHVTIPVTKRNIPWVEFVFTTTRIGRLHQLHFHTVNMVTVLHIPSHVINKASYIKRHAHAYAKTHDQRDSYGHKLSTYLMYVCPCIIYEIEERYPLDATIYLLL